MLDGRLTSTASPWARRVVEDLRWAQTLLHDSEDVLGELADRPGLMWDPEVRNEFLNVDFTAIRGCFFGSAIAPPGFLEEEEGPGEVEAPVEAEGERPVVRCQFEGC